MDPLGVALNDGLCVILAVSVLDKVPVEVLDCELVELCDEVWLNV